MIIKKITSILIPRNSRRRKFVKVIWNFFLHQRVNNYSVLKFQMVKNPLVSIIVPVYNNFNYTYQCLSAILNNSMNIKYEILIADDNSTDKTQIIKKIIKNVKIIYNKENKGFIKNCNNASKFANGKYLLFLNNDTSVKENWLSSLVELMEQNEFIGLTGSKLIYPDGRLQEAGGIVWCDGSAANYGWGSDPELPEFNYIKDVDYISGASILIRHELWNKLGGFDEQFLPAYYEDTDLAFSVRKLGYRVVYQPASVVIHYEGVSNGKDISTGLKEYQKINHWKFYKKWHQILERNHFTPNKEIFFARGNSGKKTLLVIDVRVPLYDQNAGNRSTYLYVKLFLKLGLRVIFLCYDTYPFQPYTFHLQQLGVEVLNGEYYANNWTTWIKENGKYLDYIFTNRSIVSLKYIDYLQQNTTAKIIHFLHDMSHLRLKRQFELTEDQNILKEAKEAENIEMEVSTKSDVLYVVGSYEEKILKNIFPQKIVRNIPIFYYENNNKYFLPSKKRKNLLFVGGFDHAPNEDAVLWFYKNSFNEIISAYPNIVWFIVGPNPTDKLLSIRDKHVVITGHVSEEKLKEYYQNCRICIAPLRYGAGVKGKIVEAAYYKIPIVTTHIGSEGLSLEEDAFVVNAPDYTFTKKIINLYLNYERLDQLSKNCYNFIKNHFSIDNAIKIIKKDISI